MPNPVFESIVRRLVPEIHRRGLKTFTVGEIETVLIDMNVRSLFRSPPRKVISYAIGQSYMQKLNGRKLPIVYRLVADNERPIVSPEDWLAIHPEASIERTPIRRGPRGRQ